MCLRFLEVKPARFGLFEHLADGQSLAFEIDVLPEEPENFTRLIPVVTANKIGTYILVSLAFSNTSKVSSMVKVRR